MNFFCLSFKLIILNLVNFKRVATKSGKVRKNVKKDKIQKKMDVFEKLPGKGKKLMNHYVKKKGKLKKTELC